MINEGNYPRVSLSIRHCDEGGCQCLACHGSGKMISFELAVMSTEQWERSFDLDEASVKKLVQAIASLLQKNGATGKGKLSSNEPRSEDDIEFFLEPTDYQSNGFVFRVVESKPGFPKFNGEYLVSEESLKDFVRETAALTYSTERYVQGLRARKTRQEVVRTYMKCLDLVGMKNEIKSFLSSHDNHSDNQIVDVLLTAAFITGPSISAICAHTKHSRVTVSGIARRMQDSGLWSRDEVECGHWFDHNLSWNEFEFKQDCEVARGDLVAVRGEEGRGWSYVETRRFEKENSLPGFRGEQFQRVPLQKQVEDF